MKIYIVTWGKDCADCEDTVIVGVAKTYTKAEAIIEEDKEKCGVEDLYDIDEWDVED